MKSAVKGSKSLSKLMILMFVLSLMLPNFIYIGSIRLTPYRVLLVLSLIPLLILFFQGKAGRFLAADWLVLSICLSSSLSILVVHGFVEKLETIGSFWIETLGSYLFGRIFLRSGDDFYRFVRTLFRLSFLILPFAVFEAATGANLLLEFFRRLGPSYWLASMEPRWGFERVQLTFPHPIHFGVFFLSSTGLVYYVLGFGYGYIRRLLQFSVVAFVGLLSFSSGPLVALMSQIFVMLWDRAFQSFSSKWKYFLLFSIILYILIDLFSNRTPFHVIIEYLSFNKETAYNRLRIWEYGIDSIFANPLFGIGFNDWKRPVWMSDSVDMFWIINGMRYGILVWALWFGLFFFIFVSVSMRNLVERRTNWYRMGYLVTLTGLFMSGWTVHYWDVTYVYFMFLLGAGAWFLDSDATGTALSNSVSLSSSEQNRIRHSRFNASDSTQGL